MAATGHTSMRRALNLKPTDTEGNRFHSALHKPETLLKNSPRQRIGRLTFNFVMLPFGRTTFSGHPYNRVFR